MTQNLKDDIQSTNTNDEQEFDTKNSLSTTAIIGIVFGIILLIVLIIFIYMKRDKLSSFFKKKEPTPTPSAVPNPNP